MFIFVVYFRFKTPKLQLNVATMMKAARFYGNKDLRVEEIPKPVAKVYQFLNIQPATIVLISDRDVKF